MLPTANTVVLNRMRSNIARMATPMSLAPIATSRVMTRVPRPEYAMTALLMAPSVTSAGGRTTSQAYAAVRANPPDPRSPPRPVAIPGKQKAPSLTHSALPPASIPRQAKESFHSTTTSTATSLTTGSDSHPSPNHSSRLQQQPTLQTIQHWVTSPPHHGRHLYNSPPWLTQAARAAWLA